MNTYIILGYGIPKNILQDEHYNHYLKMVFNRIFSLSANKPANIVLSGGLSDMQKPYRRSEAKEMEKLFKKLCSRSFTSQACHQWKFIREEKSLSTLENILYSRNKFKSLREIIIFCEYTRKNKVKILAGRVFGKKTKIIVEEIDFDISQNRYSTQLVKKKEAEDIKFSLWALKSPANLKKYRKVFKDKVDYLRTQDIKKHSEAIKKWWEEMLKKVATEKGYKGF